MEGEGGLCRHLDAKALGQILGRLSLAGSSRTKRVSPQLQVERPRYRHPASLSEWCNDQTSRGTLVLEAVMHPSRALLNFDGVSIPVEAATTRPIHHEQKVWLENLGKRASVIATKRSGIRQGVQWWFQPALLTRLNMAVFRQKERKLTGAVPATESSGGR